MTESRLSAKAADRELRAEVTIDAAPAAVWAALTDLQRMAERSPELISMVPLKRGGLRVGQWYLGLNRRKAVAWPTRNVVTQVDPERALAWHTATSGATWIYELASDGEGTRLVQRRPVPRLTYVSKVFAPLFLGGAGPHADELEQHMAEGLVALKAEVEGTVRA